MIPYLLYVALLLAVCLAFYKLFLQSETFYRLNRWILLGCLALSFALPLVPVPQRWSMRPAAQPELTHVAPIAANDFAQPSITPPQPVVSAPALQQKPAVAPARNLSAETKPNNTGQPKPLFQLSIPQVITWLFILYWTGVAILGINLIVQLLSTLYRAYAMQAIIDGRYRIIDLATTKVPCSFLNNIFINPEAYDWDTYNQILTHEKVHVRQLHSIDILLAEVVIIFQWFNPFAWLYRKEIENNLEYLTDREVLADQSINPAAYQLSLVKVTAPYLSLSIATNYNQSLLKKRIKMMNARKSNFHTLWKYFMLLPLFGFLACALNETAQSKELKTSFNTNLKADTGQIEGFWYGARVGDDVNMDFKVVDADLHKWNYNECSFKASDFSNGLNGKADNFEVKRDAGTILFKGKFDGDQGLGHFKLEPNYAYIKSLKRFGIDSVDLHEVLNLVTDNVSSKYLDVLWDNGFKKATLQNLTTYGFFKLPTDDIKYWAHASFKGFDENGGLSTPAILHISPDYAMQMRKVFPNLTFSELMRLKTDKVDMAYIESIARARKIPVASLTPEDVFSTKAAKADTTYLSQMAALNISLNNSDLYSFTSLKITPEYVKAFRDMGYKNLDAKAFLMLKMSHIGPGFLKPFADMGYTNLNQAQILAFNRENITPDYIKSFGSMGYNKLTPDQVIAMKGAGLTPEYITSLHTLGYKDVPLQTMIALKNREVTPGYIEGFNKLGFENISTDELLQLKTSAVTPEYITSMKQKGLDSKDIQKYITLKNSFN